jgi:hypothetical protein
MTNNEYYLWCAGTYGTRLIEFMKKELIFKAAIDSNPAKQGTIFQGIPVISFDEAMSSLPEVKIVIATNWPSPIGNFLSKQGFVRNKDFFFMHDFIPRYYWDKHRLLAAKSVDVIVTTKCNMNCKGCYVFMPMAEKRQHLSAAQVMTDMDLLFSHIDLAVCLNICVGESLLNKELSDICLSIYKKYAGRYGWILVQTNGTIMPSNAEMKRFSDSNAYFCISSYPENAGARDELIEKCIAFGIDWGYNGSGKQDRWFDFGDPRVVKETAPEKLRLLYAGCWQPGMANYDGSLYVCMQQAWAKAVVGVGSLECDDAFDLRQPMTDESRNTLYSIVARQPERGYVSHCARCNGVTKIPEYWMM